jgi:hypothetical protein
MVEGVLPETVFPMMCRTCSSVVGLEIQARRWNWLALAASLALCHPAWGDLCSIPRFGAPAILPFGSNAVFLAKGDFNQDGKMDLVIATQGSYDRPAQGHTNDLLSILAGKGDGTFQAVSDFLAGTNPVFVVVADLNGDGKADLAVANQGSYGGPPYDYPGSSVSIHLGHGDGTFQSAVYYPAGTGPAYLATGDFNGDGKADIAVAHQRGVSVLLNKGDGTFLPEIHYGTEMGWTPSVAVGDFNGDGKLDLGAAYGSGFWVRLNDGKGGFQEPQNYSAPAQLLAVADFNGDGRPDLAALGVDYGNNAASGDSGVLSLFMGQGDGTFQNPLRQLIAPNPMSVDVTDLDGNGILDLAVASGWFASLPALLLGNGDGTFESAPLNFPALGMVAGDFNGDGKIDLISSYYDTGLSVLLNEGMTQTTTPTFFQAGEYGGSVYGGGAVLGDFNGDGRPDVVFCNGDSPGGLFVLLGTGDGAFQTPIATESDPAYGLMAVSDFNGDGKLDLAVPIKSGLMVFLGKGDGSFHDPIQRGGGPGPAGVFVGDFNRDGKPDLVAVNYGDSVNDFGNVSLLLGAGDGTFGPANVFVAGLSPVDLAVGDFNSDGKLDLAVVNGNAADAKNQVLSILLGDGQGGFQPAVAYAVDKRVQPFSVVVGDFNGDGQMDVLVGSSDLDSWDPKTGKVDGLLWIFIGKGDGTFLSPLAYRGMADVPTSIAVGDINGDGRPDLVVAGHGSSYRPGGASILLGKGDGSFETIASYPGHSLGEVFLSDLNNDGKLDFLTTYSDDLAGKRAVIWLNNSCAPRLSIAAGRNQASLTISWPRQVTNFVLETSRSVNGSEWLPLGNPQLTPNDRWNVVTNSAGSQGYFRLRRQ